MITLDFNDIEYYDEEKSEFISFPPKLVNFEYTLFAVAKWEERWRKPFLTSELRSDDPMLIDFFICMGDDPTLSPVYFYDPSVGMILNNYIKDPMSATRFLKEPASGRGKDYTAEEIYALMFMNGIPIEFENRNLNKLLTILRVISAYNSPPKKKTQREILAENVALNEQRKKKYNTKG